MRSWSVLAVLLAAPAVSLVISPSPNSRLQHFPAQASNSSSSETWLEAWNKVWTLQPLPDKFSTHDYRPMYMKMLQRFHSWKEGPKMLEIGLGCDMPYGAGASVPLWHHLLPKVDLWEADYNGDCIRQKMGDGSLPGGFKPLTGDQGDRSVVNAWVQESGGKFDIIVDDGGHKNTQIKTSFEVLWPQLNQGGLYFMEDLQVGRDVRGDDTDGKAVMSDVIQDWINQLLIFAQGQKPNKFPMPPDVDFILCQREACVIGKKPWCPEAAI